MIHPKPRSYSVNDFLNWNAGGELILQPRFQRRNAWSPAAKSNLVDTILRGLPSPLIFVRQSVDPRQRRTIREVVDGQQRLRSVIEFYGNVFPVMVSQNEDYGGMRFEELPIDVQRDFLSYEFSVVLLEAASDATVLDIFARLNSYSLRLNAQELLNAAFFGEFKKTVYALGQEHLEFWRSNRILTDSQIIRMAEADITTELLVVTLEGIQHRRAKIRDLYASRDDRFLEKDRVSAAFRATIDIIRTCLGDRLKRTAFRRRALFHSLFCAFYHSTQGIPHARLPGQGRLGRSPSQSDLSSVRESLLRLDKQYKTTPTPPELEQFYLACKSGTHDKDQRMLRTRTILQYMIESTR